MVRSVEIWLDYRREIVALSQRTRGALRFVYRMLTLGSNNVSERSLRIDERLGYFITLIGIPSAFLLHGYVGFIFGSQNFCEPAPNSWKILRATTECCILLRPLGPRPLGPISH